MEGELLTAVSRENLELERCPDADTDLGPFADGESDLGMEETNDSVPNLFIPLASSRGSVETTTEEQASDSEPQAISDSSEAEPAVRSVSLNFCMEGATVEHNRRRPPSRPLPSLPPALKKPTSLDLPPTPHSPDIPAVSVTPSFPDSRSNNDTGLQDLTQDMPIMSLPPTSSSSSSLSTNTVALLPPVPRSTLPNVGIGLQDPTPVGFSDDNAPQKQTHMSAHCASRLIKL
ncbi:hypothetical protein EW145_g191 [Phellinidium pouzarii]|uniref:Uncharacterized protein n=1 Tax=Phellinidium pouzarii TaxID=167371 RepID=A0A4S4LJK1_9AGAM|nr:hypothetical protein EW145_g191 [Phellinidium pouzarii]